jgi:hypothetical protein
LLPSASCSESYAIPKEVSGRTLRALAAIAFSHLRIFGNRLAAAKVETNDGERIELRKIQPPLIVFCSFGDDITLYWIFDLYDSASRS